MEVRFRTRKLEDMFRYGAVGERELGRELAQRYYLRIRTLEQVDSLNELRHTPWLRCHPLKGDRKGEWAINLDRYHRLIFTVLSSVPIVLRIEEVSKHYGD